MTAAAALTWDDVFSRPMHEDVVVIAAQCIVCRQRFALRVTDEALQLDDSRLVDVHQYEHRVLVAVR